MLWSTFPDIQAQLEWAGCPPHLSPHPLCGGPSHAGWVVSGKWAQTAVGAGG